jgi:hypothetical protein
MSSRAQLEGHNLQAALDQLHADVRRNIWRPIGWWTAR